MVKKISVYRLSPEEKNKISQLAELALESGDKKTDQLWKDLYEYIESTYDDVVTQCSNNTK